MNNYQLIIINEEGVMSEATNHCMVIHDKITYDNIDNCSLLIVNLAISQLNIF